MPISASNDGHTYKVITRTNLDNESIKKFAIFMNNGQVITIDAFDYEWGDDVVEFYGGKFNFDDDNVIATFKTSILYAVSQCCYNVDSNNVLMLPKYDDENSEEKEENSILE